jgi:hypothetical protein
MTSCNQGDKYHLNKVIIVIVTVKGNKSRGSKKHQHLGIEVRGGWWLIRGAIHCTPFFSLKKQGIIIIHELGIQFQSHGSPQGNWLNIEDVLLAIGDETNYWRWYLVMSFDFWFFEISSRVSWYPVDSHLKIGTPRRFCCQLGACLKMLKIGPYSSHVQTILGASNITFQGHPTNRNCLTTQVC